MGQEKDRYLARAEWAEGIYSARIREKLWWEAIERAARGAKDPEPPKPLPPNVQRLADLGR